MSAAALLAKHPSPTDEELDTAMAGNLVARGLVEGDETWRKFTPFELVWAGGVFGRAASQIRVWARRLRDAVEERRAKARELAFRHARQSAGVDA